MKKFFSNVPIRTIIEVWQNERNEVVIFLVARAHNLIDAEQASYCLLSDNIFAICEFFDNEWDMSS
jgi:hypothetical protein